MSFAMNLSLNEKYKVPESKIAQVTTKEDFYLEGSNTQSLELVDSQTKFRETSSLSDTLVRLRVLRDIYARCNVSCLNLRSMKKLKLIVLGIKQWR